ncbi:BLUF domain-containing protein [Halochromatium salexigens]|uniref:BLUF domain-containing protein n=1 Tax=Halochromatium salexigens TaxID=49447 RepID=A0AAJ0XF86_HALSE|nr:BLUF domain-containing protein [Halochromatium salexigens]MBK5929490.1 hypothetical protein [Halochromatium salexigens]
MPFQLCYASTATRELNRDDLLQILNYARQHNAEQGITGLLLFQGGHFLQVLEGEADQIRNLFKQISKDERHHQITLLFEELVSRSQYPDWSMGFQTMDGTEWMEFPQEDSNPQDLRTLAQTMGRAKELLMYVRKQGLDPAKDIF